MSSNAARTVEPRTQDEIEHDIVLNIRALMASKGVTGTTLGERLGYTRQKVSQRLTRETRLNASELVIIAEALDVPADLLALPHGEVLRSRCSTRPLRVLHGGGRGGGGRAPLRVVDQ